MSSLLTLTNICCAMLLVLETQGVLWYNEKYSHAPKPLTTEELRRLATVAPKISFESLLDPILVPRVSGSENNKVVRQYIKNHMSNLGWTIESDAFEGETPHGMKQFENVIATLNPNLPRRLVLACHYDSKYFRENNFVGATDSAVPCAMMLHLAYTLQNPLELHRQSPTNNVTLQFIFFDGEEAFNHWSDTDSLYGARHLAETMEKTPYPPGNTAGTNELHRMDMLVLLDLLGTANPTFPNFFESTSHWHNQLVEIETVLRNGRMWSGNIRGKTHFKSQSSYGGVEDDHIPFLQRSVDIVHIISVPFPRVWHTAEDNRENLDFPTIDNLNRILRVFVGRYLHLSVNDIGQLWKCRTNAATASPVPEFFTSSSTSSTTFLAAFMDMDMDSPQKKTKSEL